MPSKLRFAGVTFSVPMSWIGTALQGNAKKQFLALKSKIDVYNAYEINSENTLIILDAIERIKEGGYSRSVPVLNEIVHYLRVLLLSSEAEIVFHTLVLLDVIVKNSGFVLHIMIGRRKFMKTISWVARKHSSEPSQASRKVSNMALDCVQAWGEAFYPREEFYPHIYQTYLKLRCKYKMRFPRPDFDPTRVPIFLGEISHSEKTMANTFNNDLELNYGSLEETKEEPRTVHRETLRTPRQPIQPLRPPRGYVSPPESPVGLGGAGHAVVDVPQLDEKDLIEFEHSDFFFSPRQEPSYSDTDFGTLDLSEKNYSRDPPPSAAVTAPSAPLRALSGTKLSPAEEVMSLYRPSSLVATFATPVPNPPSVPSAPALPPALPPMPTQLSQASMLSNVYPSTSPLHVATPWDAAWSSTSSFTAPVDGNPSLHSTLVRSHSLPSTSSRSIGNTAWDLDGALDLARLAESLPVGREKTTPSQTALWLREHTFSAARTVPVLPPLPPPPQSPPGSHKVEPVTTEDVDVVAAALADFELKMVEVQSLSEAAMPDQSDCPPPPLPPSPSVLAPSAMPPAAVPQPAALSNPPEAPRVPPPPPPSPMTIADASRNCVSTGLPDWLDVSPLRPATPPPVPTTPPPSVAISPDILNPLEGPSRSTSSDEDPILTLIQNMNNPDTIAPHSEVPRLQPPVQGPTRLIKPSPRRPSDALLQMTFNEKIQQQRAKLAHIDAPVATTVSADKTARGQAPKPFEDVVLTRFDPTAGPRPSPPPKRTEPRKVSFTAPSSDPNNEIKYYGNQRVVLRKTV